MSTLDYNALAQDMLSAIKDVAVDNFDDIKELAEDELEDFAKRTAILSQKVLEGKINQEQAQAILRIRRNAVETVLLSIAGISVLTAQEALNAAISVLKQALSTAIPGVSIL